MVTQTFKVEANGECSAEILDTRTNKKIKLQIKPKTMRDGSIVFEADIQGCTVGRLEAQKLQCNSGTFGKDNCKAPLGPFDSNTASFNFYPMSNKSEESYQKNYIYIDTIDTERYGAHKYYKGVGTALMLCAIQLANNDTYEGRVQLKPVDKAEPFYQKMHFTQANEVMFLNKEAIAFYRQTLPH